MRIASGIVIGLVTLTAPCLAASTGEALYRRYCASCHGTNGRGDGPVASDFKAPPTDLTRIALTVPALMECIDGRRTLRAHGSAEMPVWGKVLEGAREGEPHKGRTTLLEVRELAEYVRSLQSRQ